MQLHFQKMCKKNRKELEMLEIMPEQEGFIETVRECLEEADREAEWRPVGIYDGEILVGFAMYGFFKEDGRVWLDRLLIDRKYQNRGYGRVAVSALLQRLTEEYTCEQIYLSVYEENEKAISLYQKLGFLFTGERDTKGEKIMVKKLKNN